MVGYPWPPYQRFGWAGARLDDLLNWIPARLCWLLTGLCALALPGLNGRKAFSLGWRHRRRSKSPNSGWAEASFAGALGRRLGGPVVRRGQRMEEPWLGDEEDPPGAGAREIRRGAALALAQSLLLALLLVGLRWCWGEGGF